MWTVNEDVDAEEHIFTPLMEALRREKCRNAADAWDAAFTPESVEARRQAAVREAQREIAEKRATLAADIAAARANELARAMSWEQMVKEFLS